MSATTPQTSWTCSFQGTLVVTVMTYGCWSNRLAGYEVGGIIWVQFVGYIIYLVGPVQFIGYVI